ncbi:MAG TPA: carboxylating nicotinate-nucleotide diphosphorylase [Candidatus Eisenbacteria bacterium]|nr:carboxylating nicotinate-nucleotide diphosphorylase [Candidatus Eisenbacteria bacterium]
MNLETIALHTVKVALMEDLWGGDVTTQATVGPDVIAEASILAKANGVLAGLDVARLVFREVDAEITMTGDAKDGQRVQPGREVARLHGKAASILSAERTALNFLCHLSGVATLTSRFVRRTRGTGAVILDTRKTLPGLRVLEKYAVQKGGGENHRIGLGDMYLVKDNHIKAAGSITLAVERIQAHRQELLLEVEAQTFEQVKEACEAGIDRILFDNMSLEQIALALQIVDNHPKPATPPHARRKGAKRWPEVEVSGGISLDNVKEIAELGVDFISVGALTHSAPALDLSLEILTLD